LKFTTVTPIHTSKEIDMKGSILILVCAVLYSVDACNGGVDFDDAKEAAKGKGDIEDLKEYLEDNKAVDERDLTAGMDGKTLLMYAVDWGNSEAISLLLAKGADVNAGNNYGTTPLMVAALNFNQPARILRNLLSVPGIDVNRQKKYNKKTALMLAAYHNNTPNVKILLENDDIDVNIEDANGNTALGWARNWAIKKMLEEHGAVCKCVGSWCRKSSGNCQ